MLRLTCDSRKSLYTMKRDLPKIKSNKIKHKPEKMKFQKKNTAINNIITNILPEPSGGFRPKVALTTCMSSCKFFSKVVSRDLIIFSMLRESWFTLTITRLSLFLVGPGDAFDPVETLLSSTVADRITVTQDSNRINHMTRDECILQITCSAVRFLNSPV